MLFCALKIKAQKIKDIKRNFFNDGLNELIRFI